MNYIQQLWEDSPYNELTFFKVIMHSLFCHLSYDYMVNKTEMFEVFYSIIILAMLVGLYGFKAFNDNLKNLIASDDEPDDDFIHRIEIMFVGLKASKLSNFVNRFVDVFVCCTFAFGGAYVMLIIYAILSLGAEILKHKLIISIKG